MDGTKKQLTRHAELFKTDVINMDKLLRRHCLDSTEKSKSFLVRTLIAQFRRGLNTADEELSSLETFGFYWALEQQNVAEVLRQAADLQANQFYQTVKKSSEGNMETNSKEGTFSKVRSK